MKKEADSRIDATPGEPRQQGCGRDVLDVQYALCAYTPGTIGTMSATAAQTTTHAWSVPPRDMRHGLAASLARQIDMSSLALICGTAERRTPSPRGMQQPWQRGCCRAASGGREKILIKGSSMKGVLSKQHSLVVFLGGVA